MGVTAISRAGHSECAKDQKKRTCLLRCLTEREPDFGGGFNTVLKIIIYTLDFFFYAVTVSLEEKFLAILH